MRIKYQLSLADWLEAQNAHAGLSGKLLPSLGIFFVFIGAVSLVFDPRNVASAAPLLVLGVFFMLARPLQLRAEYKRDSKVRDPIEVAISVAGVDISGPTWRASLGWSTFVRWVETKNLFLLYQAPRLFNCFPKRVFNPTDLDAFRTLLSERVPKRSTARPSYVKIVFFWAVMLAAVILLFLSVRRAH